MDFPLIDRISSIPSGANSVDLVHFSEHMGIAQNQRARAARDRTCLSFQVSNAILGMPQLFAAASPAFGLGEGRGPRQAQRSREWGVSLRKVNASTWLWPGRWFLKTWGACQGSM